MQAKSEKEKTSLITKESEALLRLGGNLLTLLNHGNPSVRAPDTPEALIGILHNIKQVRGQRDQKCASLSLFNFSNWRT